MLEEAKGDLVIELEIHKAMIGYLKIKLAEAQEKSDIEMIKIIQEQIDFSNHNDRNGYGRDGIAELDIKQTITKLSSIYNSINTDINNNLKNYKIILDRLELVSKFILSNKINKKLS